MPLNETVVEVVHPQADFMKTVVCDIKGLFPPGVLHTCVTDIQADLGKDAQMDSLYIGCKDDGLMIILRREEAEPWLCSHVKPGKLMLATCGSVVGPVEPNGPYLVLFVKQEVYVDPGTKKWVLDTCRLMLDLHHVHKAGLEPARFTSMLNRGEP